MQKRPLIVLAALAAAAEPDFGLGAATRLKEGFRAKYDADPIGTTVTTVLLASMLFYRAERGHNPKVRTFYDALVYVSTSLSVGYSDIFAKTATGKLVGSALMTVGPAMAASMFDGRPAPENAAVVERLDRIIAALEKREAAPSSDVAAP